MNIRFHHIARAIIVVDGQMLVARMIGAHSFLPGGHVDLGEGAEKALRRELMEELGLQDAKVGRYLGTVETSFYEEDKDLLHHEITHLFEARSSELSPDQPPQSRESHLEFYWAEATVESLQHHNVLPAVVQTHIPALLADGIPRWISTMEK